MEDITEVASELISDNNAKTASLVSAVGLAIMAGSIYGVGKLVGKRRQKKLQKQLPIATQQVIDYLETQGR